MGVKAAIYNNADIGDIHILDVEKFEKRQMVKDTDKGKEIKQLINDLKDLLELYKKGRKEHRRLALRWYLLLGTELHSRCHDVFQDAL